MLKAFKKALTGFIRFVYDSICKLFKYIKKLFKSDVSKDLKVDTENKDNSGDKSHELGSSKSKVAIGDPLQISRDNSAEPSRINQNNIIQENIDRNPSTTIPPYNDNQKNGKTCSTGLSSKRRKYENIRYILRNHEYCVFEIEKIFSINDVLLNKMKGDVELLKIVLKSCNNADDVIDVYSKNATVSGIMGSILETSNIEPSDKNRLKRCLGIVSALYESGSIKDINIIFDDKLIHNSVSTYFKHTVEPIVQAQFQQKCNLNCLLKGTLNYKESEEASSQISSLQQTCIESLIKGTTSSETLLPLLR